jgi:chromosome segregation ATPase
MPTTTKQRKPTVEAELADQLANAARIRRRQTELSDTRRELGARKSQSGRIGEAWSRRLAEHAQSVAEDRPLDTKTIDAELAELEHKRDSVSAELVACKTALEQIQDARQSTLTNRHAELVAIAATLTDEGGELIATAAAATADLEEHRAKVRNAAALAAAGIEGDRDVRRVFMSASAAPFVVATDAEGRTRVGDSLPAYWAAVTVVAAGPRAAI